jgi:2-hydroxy-3-oxopropionate reductase
LSALKRGLGYLDAPVSGGTKGAEEASLSIMAGGEAEDFEFASPVFDVLGRATHVGPVGCGQLVKLANQAIVAINIGAVAEAMLLGQKGGADPAAMRTALMGGHAESRVLREHGQRMLDRNFEPGGKAAIHLKDLNTVMSEAGSLNLELPITHVLKSLFVDLCNERDGEKLDHSALLLQLESLNGI